MVAYTDTVDAVTTVRNRTYNAKNQLVSNNNSTTSITAFDYDKNGNLILETPPANNGPFKVYEFNQRNLMTVYCENGDCDTSANVKTTFRYDGANDRVAQVGWENGSPVHTTTYTNDTLGLTQVLVSDDGTNETYNLFGLGHIGYEIAGSASFTTLVADVLGR